MIHARAWCRVDLAGGTLDIWPLGLFHPHGRTVAVAIDLAAEVEIAPRSHGWSVEHDGGVVEAPTVAELVANPDVALLGLLVQALDLRPCAVRARSASPRGAGLGASSALGIAMAAAGFVWKGEEPGPEDRLVAFVRDLEARLMGLPTGVQDHWIALRGAAQEIALRPGGAQVRPLAVDLERLGAHLVVAYSGSSHVSAETNWGIVRRRLEREPATVERFERIADVAAELAAALAGDDLARVGALMAEEWRARRELAPGISTPAIERLLEAAVDSGAWGGKACGAGGGGCVAVLAPADRREGVAAALASAGGSVLAARPQPLALQVVARG